MVWKNAEMEEGGLLPDDAEEFNRLLSDEFAGVSVPMPPDFPLYEYSASVDDLFSDVQRRKVDYSNFVGAFERVGIPHSLARRLIDACFVPQEDAGEPFIKFVRLSTLRSCTRIPAFDEVEDDLVDHRNIDGFVLRGLLDWNGGTSLLENQSCIMVSHRWQSISHPDPRGEQLVRLLGRLDELSDPSAARSRLTSSAPQDGRDRRPSQPSRPRFVDHGQLDELSDDDVYLWIDFSCLPPSSRPAPSDAALKGRTGLADIPGIVKSCDLLVLSSPDYLRRLWCYTELFIWLCMLHERDSFALGDHGLFRSVQSRSIVQPASMWAGMSNEELHTNLRFRGFDGEQVDLLAIAEPLRRYTRSMGESGNYHVAGGSPGFDAEYLMHMVRFVCSSWYVLNRLESTVEADVEICLELTIEALRYSRAGTGGPAGTW